VNITIDGQRIEQEKRFNYLDLVITENGRSRSDVNKRIAMANDAFNKRNELLTKGLSTRLKNRIVKAVAQPGGKCLFRPEISREFIFW